MKGFDVALWRNTYKQEGSRQPDLRGSISIPISVLRELSTAYQAKELTTEQDDRNECEVVKLDVSAWKNDPEGNRPLLKAEVKNWTEMKEQQARRDAKNAETAGASSGGGGSDWMPF